MNYINYIHAFRDELHENSSSGHRISLRYTFSDEENVIKFLFGIGY